jgi:hypothetical protein
MTPCRTTRGRRHAIALLWALCALLVVPGARAQQLARAAVAARATPTPASVALRAQLRLEAQEPPMSKYVLVGAAIGAAITGGYVWYRSRDCGTDECYFRGFVIAGAAGVGGLLGGLIGAMVWADRSPGE